MEAELQFIGHIESPCKSLEECPRNVEPDGPASRLVLDPRFADGLLGPDCLDGTPLVDIKPAMPGETPEARVL
jgi:tRNA (Thr-GGU) A37 N-methylase